MFGYKCCVYYNINIYENKYPRWNINKPSLSFVLNKEKILLYLTLSKKQVCNKNGGYNTGQIGDEAGRNSVTRSFDPHRTEV